MRFVICKLFLAIILFFSLPLSANSSEANNLTIFAESNMVYALTEIGRAYSKEKNVTVSINLNSSFELIQNIDAGEPSDIFISSHQDWIENLKQKGLVDVYNIINIARDSLLLITSNKNTKINNIKTQNSNLKDIFRIIDKDNIPLIISSEYTSLGRYTNQVIKKYNIDKFNVYKKINEDKSSIMSFIDENNSYCGIILASEIKGYDNIQIIAEFDDLEIYYQALVIAGDNMERARDFLKYLKSKTAKDIPRRQGFVVK